MSSRPTWSRETRLLLLTIAVAAAVLLVLARFRFPDEAPAPPPQPLERLAARATFDELAGIVERLDRTIAPSLVVLRVASSEAQASRSLSTLLGGSEEQRRAVSYVLALRVRPDAALALLDPAQTVQGIVGDESAVPLVIARDPLRRLALVRVPPSDAWQWRAPDGIDVPRYVVSVEASRGGPTLRPLFFSRADRFSDPRWSRPLLVLGQASGAAEGSIVFSLQGELLGLTIESDGALALVPAESVQAVADRLFERGTPQLTDFGLSLRPIGTTDANTLGVTSGLIVAGVAPGSLAEGRLRAGDLVQAVDGIPALNVDALLLDLADTPPETTVTFTIKRGDDTLDVAVTTGPAAPNGAGS